MDSIEGTDNPAVGLLRRVQDRDQEAFSELFSLHRDRLRRMLEHRADRRLAPRVDASDILQDTYIAAWCRIDHFLRKPEMSFYVWLRQITLQRLVDSHRRHFGTGMRSLNAELSFSSSQASSIALSWVVGSVAPELSPSQIVMHDELVAKVERVLGAMEELDREVLVLRHFEEMKNGEVAQVLGLSPAAASNRYVRALKRLQSAMVDPME